MRAGSSRIWFSTSNNQPNSYPTNQQADHSRHTDHPTDKRLTDQHNPDGIPQAPPSHASHTSPAYPHQHGFRSRLVDGYSQLVTDRVQAGWSCDLVTIIFSRMFGPRASVLSQMRDEVQRVYSTLLTRVHRKPRTAPTDELPVLVGALDLPGFKRDRSSAPRVVHNDGLHFHALILLPPRSRLRGSLADLFQRNSDLYAGETSLVERVHVVPVMHDHERVVDYVLKTVLNGRLSLDEALVVLPRARGELDHSVPSTPLDMRSEADFAWAGCSRPLFPIRLSASSIWQLSPRRIDRTWDRPSSARRSCVRRTP